MVTGMEWLSARMRLSTSTPLSTSSAVAPRTPGGETALESRMVLRSRSSEFSALICST